MRGQGASAEYYLLPRYEYESLDDDDVERNADWYIFNNEVAQC